MTTTCEKCPFYKYESPYGTRHVTHWCYAEPGAPVKRLVSESYEAPNACRLHPAHKEAADA